MDNMQLPLTRDLVLIGGGHAHALVLRRWGMNRLPGARLTVISPEPMAAYSGMLPGYVAGHYARAALDIDLVRLARFAGARLVLGAATDIDLAARQVTVPGRPPVAFDICSIDVGITSAMPDLPGFDDHAVPAKPLDRFADSWRAVIGGSTPVQVAVIGAGVAGAELAMAMAHALRARGRNGQVTLIDAAGALPGLGARAARAVRDGLAAQGVTLIERTGATAVEPGAVLLADGRRVEADFVTGAAGAQPHGWLAQTGLVLENGFVAVDDRLQTSDAAVFAAGDCAHMTTSPRPKAGVYAVRQAPVLFENLRAALSGGRMRRYRPQRDYLKLISLGDKAAVGERFGLVKSGPAMWRWKDRIDSRFMDRFRDLPVMGLPDLPEPRAQGMEQALGGKPLCGGCGAKVGRGALRAALVPLATGAHTDITPLPGDDAALLHTGGARQVLSSDHLRAFIDDPVVMARIAAVHALGDIWAMGAAPQAATANLVLPRLSAELQERMMREIMTAATGIMRGAGAEIVGGHSSVGAELTIGFSVTGLCGHEPVTLAKGRAGDALILTKPIGTGVVMAGEMAGRARGDHVVAALEQMARPQAEAARVLAGAHAMTDVTGFGLAGHLLNICEASGTGAVLCPEAVPLLDGAADLSAQGVRSSLWADNRAAVPSLPDGGIAELLFDPQTAGGLLAAVPRGEVDRILAALHWLGFAAARIGALTDGPPYPVTGPLPA
ncbi:selenide, water dikinase SelD [Pukyongiella litopenaei]|uniref:Selenide, water dikinase SelD n=1 Tax=Pukyongiella litopenaei TaxID=2605946 RepID=A0A2S0MRU1_9RHOB|nr:selenide, water dikinase SelD [Pukyongiella litopenaei]AVO38600.1 selenide, water dikinase SelD [Pukyongiella litopenaei]